MRRRLAAVAGLVFAFASTRAKQSETESNTPVYRVEPGEQRGVVCLADAIVPL